MRFARHTLHTAAWAFVAWAAIYVIDLVTRKPPEIDMSAIPADRITGPTVREAIILYGGDPNDVED